MSRLLVKLRRVLRGPTEPQLAVIGAAVVAFVVASGCGDDTPEKPTVPVAITDQRARDAYIEAADRICAKALDRTRRLTRRAFEEIPTYAGTPLEATTSLLVKPGIAIREQQAEALMRLQEPAGENRDLDTFLGLFATIDELSRQRLRAGEAGDATEAARLENVLTRLGREQQQAARAFGFADCSLDVIAEAFS